MASDLSMAQKVLLALYRLSTDGCRKVRYEDIVVQVFRDYPANFHLKGYSEFPDSGDSVHKPLYDFRKKGMVSASNKMFSLTPHGLAEAQKLLALETGQSIPIDPHHRLERDAQIEIERIRHLESFRLFLEGKQDEIIDTDLYEYLGVSVRTSRNDFIGRLETVNSAITAAMNAAANDAALLALRQFNEFMINRFTNEIAFKTAAGPR